MDGARLVQLLRGAINADLMLIQLQLRERKGNPPTFLELRKEIRTEEEYEASRAKLNHSVYTVHTKLPEANKHSEIQNLRAEIKEVKSMFAALSTQDKVTRNENFKTNLEKALETNADPEVVALRKQVKQLQKVNSRLPRPSTTSPTVMTVNTSNGQSTEAEERFCYRCGENGHMAGKCKNPESQNKVIQRLIQALKKAKTHSPPPTGGATSPETDCTVRRSAVDQFASAGIPECLIGPPSVEPLRVNGHLCDALLDSGSWVSIIFES